jgi:hypothetical protein
VSIHDVHVDNTPSTLARRAHLLTQPGKVSRKNRRRQFDQRGPLEPELSVRMPLAKILTRGAHVARTRPERSRSACPELVEGSPARERSQQDEKL